MSLSCFHWLFPGNLRTPPAFFFPNCWVIQQGQGDTSRGTFPGLAIGVRNIIRIPTAYPSPRGSCYFIRARLIISLIIFMEGRKRQQRVKLENPGAKGFVLCPKTTSAAAILRGIWPCIPRAWMGMATSPSQTQHPRKTQNQRILEAGKAL